MHICSLNSKQFQFQFNMQNVTDKTQLNEINEHVNLDNNNIRRKMMMKILSINCGYVSTSKCLWTIAFQKGF